MTDKIREYISSRDIELVRLGIEILKKSFSIIEIKEIIKSHELSCFNYIYKDDTIEVIESNWYSGPFLKDPTKILKLIPNLTKRINNYELPITSDDNRNDNVEG